MAKARSKGPKRRRALRARPIKLTNAAKIREIKRLLPLLPRPQGQLNSVVLSARNPFVANVAHCNFQRAYMVDPDGDRVEYEATGPPRNFEEAHRPVLVVVDFRVFHPNKAHLLTIHISSDHAQSFFLGNNHSGADHESQLVDVSSGPNTILFAFLPTKSGRQHFSLQPVRPMGEGTARFEFFRAEIDVLT